MVAMHRRLFVSTLLSGAGLSLLWAQGCRGRQVAHVLKEDDQDMVGSHAAGAETWKPLIDTAVSQLLARQVSEIRTAAAVGDAPSDFGKKRICFVGVENRSNEEIGDFKEQIYDHIDTMISQSDSFQPVSKRYVDAGLKTCGLRPDDLFIPTNQQVFTQALQRINQPFDYLLYAKVTSGTTRNNNSTQKDYELVLELVDMHSGESDKETANLRKGYHKTGLGKIRNYGAG